MAFLKSAKGLTEIKRMTLANLRKAYIELADDYNKIINLDYIYCPHCNTWKSKKMFYISKDNASGYQDWCKDCYLEAATKPVETKESVQRVLRMMNRPYIDSLYSRCVEAISDQDERVRVSAFSNYMTSIASLPQYSKSSWDKSDFGTSKNEEDSVFEHNEENEELIKRGKKRFGNYPQEDLYFLENEYEDWASRYTIETKVQEVLFQRVCCKELEIDKATKDGRDTSKLDKDLQDMMDSLNVKPSQSNAEAVADTLTIAGLIDKWENTKPISEPAPEFKDVDRIGLLIDVFFKGHLARAYDLKNAFSKTYQKFISKYTVQKNVEGEDSESEEAFDKIFGSNEAIKNAEVS